MQRIRPLPLLCRFRFSRAAVHPFEVGFDMKAEAVVEQVAGHCFDLLAGRFSNLYASFWQISRPMELDIEDEITEIRLEWDRRDKLNIEHLAAATDAFPRGVIPPWFVSVTSNAPDPGVSFGRRKTLQIKRIEDNSETHFLSFTFARTIVDQLALECIASDALSCPSLSILVRNATGKVSTVFNHHTEERAFHAQAAEINTSPAHMALVSTAIRAVSILASQNDMPHRRLRRFEARFGTEARAALTKQINERWLYPREREVSIHSTIRTFRFWSQKEKSDYLAEVAHFISVLKRINIDAMVCYGTLLGAIRDGDLIPHDDDIDIVIFDPSNAQFRAIARRIRAAAENAGYRVMAKKHTHMLIQRDENPIFDVFHCRVTQDRCEFNPSRSTFSTVQTVFPLGEMELFGHRVPVPAQPETLLEDIYGPGWRTPTPTFEHKKPPKTKE